MANHIYNLLCVLGQYFLYLPLVTASKVIKDELLDKNEHINRMLAVTS